MTAPIMNVRYGEDWDADARDLLGPLRTATARARHEAGTRYAVLLSNGDAPQALLQVGVADRYLGVWLFDGQRRRAARIELREMLEGRLFPLALEHWGYQAEDQAEFDPGAALHRERYDHRGRVTVHREPRGADGPASETVNVIDADPLWRDFPEFGDWVPLLTSLSGASTSTSTPRPTLREAEDSEVVETPVPAGTRLWEPPRPLLPERPDRLFVEGCRSVFRDGRPALSRDPLAAGTLVLPTGRVVTADPHSVEADTDPLVVRLPKGRHPVELALVDTERPGEGPLVAAARVRWGGGVPTSWEPALRAGQDPLELRAGEFFGFGVDSGLACLCAAEATGWAARVVSEDAVPPVDVEKPVELVDSSSGGSLVVFRAGEGDGSYPTWLGRDAEGAPCALVVDFLLVSTEDE
ncbi:hypothetical protein C1701_16385 [Actinoalloteichus sp. AHMU CJ021]|uniref:DUF4241 domain-containing protein n=1 Tax=Actinoalloteichus sp. AHMU CJ021 TaxID=2072503 RepID=UPI000CA049D9|nr:hypothetical protein C1701_16385 [Actinoalloteichus sp. AHMU CJ021]